MNDFAEPAATPPAVPAHLAAPVAPVAPVVAAPAAPAPADPDWRSGFPDNVQAWDEAKNAATPEAFWQQIESHRSMLGQSIRKPSEDASDAERQAYRDKLLKLDTGLMQTPNPDDAAATASLYQALGKPEAPDGYTLTAPEGIQYDAAVIDSMRAAAHGLNLTNAQFDGFVRAQAEMNIKAQATVQEGVSLADHSLRQEWGLAYDEKVATAKAAFSRYFPDLDATQLGPQQLSGFAKMAADLGVEGTNLGLQHGRGGAGEMTPEEATIKLGEIDRNPNHPSKLSVDGPEKSAGMRQVAKLVAASLGLPPPDDLKERF